MILQLASQGYYVEVQYFVASAIKFHLIFFLLQSLRLFNSQGYPAPPQYKQHLWTLWPAGISYTDKIPSPQLLENSSKLGLVLLVKSVSLHTLLSVHSSSSSLFPASHAPWFSYWSLPLLPLVIISKGAKCQILYMIQTRQVQCISLFFCENQLCYHILMWHNPSLTEQNRTLFVCCFPFTSISSPDFSTPSPSKALELKIKRLVKCPDYPFYHFLNLDVNRKTKLLLQHCSKLCWEQL